MSDESAAWQAIYDRHRALFQKAMTQRLSAQETELLNSVFAQLDSLEPYLDCYVETVDPSDEAAATFDDHYRRKVELDRKFFRDDN